MMKRTDRCNEFSDRGAMAPGLGLRWSGRLGGTALRAIRRTAVGEGNTLVEFALVAPLMVAMVLAIFTFGLAFQNYLVLTSAVGSGARALALSRGQSGVTDPCAYAVSIVYAGSPSLAQASFTFTITLTQVTAGGKTVTSTYGASCPSTILLPGESAQLSATYPVMINLYGFAPTQMNLSASTAELVQ